MQCKGSSVRGFLSNAVWLCCRKHKTGPIFQWVFATSALALGVTVWAVLVKSEQCFFDANKRLGLMWKRIPKETGFAKDDRYTASVRIQWLAFSFNAELLKDLKGACHCVTVIKERNLDERNLDGPQSETTGCTYDYQTMGFSSKKKNKIMGCNKCR